MPVIGMLSPLAQTWGQMSHRVAQIQPLAGPVSSVPSAAPARPVGAQRPMILMVSPTPAGLAELGAAVQEGLPGADALVFPDATKALEKAETCRHFGWAPAIFVFDYRGGRAGDLADGLRKVRAAEPNAELLVLIEDGDLTLWRAALKVVPAPDKLTFL